MPYMERTRYCKKLTKHNIYGNSRTRYVEFKDENGEILTWYTTDYNNKVASMPETGIYSFTVDYIYKGTIKIKTLMRRSEDELQRAQKQVCKGA